MDFTQYGPQKPDAYVVAYRSVDGKTVELKTVMTYLQARRAVRSFPRTGEIRRAPRLI